MDYLLQRMSRKINEKQRETIFSKAISFSLKHNQKGALKILLERGAALSPFSAGRRFCFVRHFLDLHKSELSNDEPAGRESAGSSSSWWRKAKQKVALVAKQNVLNAKKKQSESENQYFRAARHWQVMSCFGLLPSGPGTGRLMPLVSSPNDVFIQFDLHNLVEIAVLVMLLAAGNNMTRRG